jgi:AraC-like DNA-binding protein
VSFYHFTPQASSNSPVRSFSILEEPQFVFNQRITLPEAYPFLLVNVGSPLVCEIKNGSKIELPRAFLLWAQTYPLKIHATGFCHFIGIHLNTWELRFLVDEQVSLTKTSIIPLSNAWQNVPYLLEGALRSGGKLEALAVLEQFLNDLHHSASINITSARVILEKLYEANGQCSVDELAAQCYFSVSQLERLVKYFTGQTPKTLARLIRFDDACSGLLNVPPNHLTDLAYTLGYADQAHFNHEFRAFSGSSPRKVRNYVYQLATSAEFLQFP